MRNNVQWQRFPGLRLFEDLLIFRCRYDIKIDILTLTKILYLWILYKKVTLLKGVTFDSGAVASMHFHWCRWCKAGKKFHNFFIKTKEFNLVYNVYLFDQNVFKNKKCTWKYCKQHWFQYKSVIQKINLSGKHTEQLNVLNVSRGQLK